MGSLKKKRKKERKKSMPVGSRGNASKDSDVISSWEGGREGM